MDTITAPRVNKSMLSRFVNRTDGMIVKIKSRPGSDYGSKTVEVIGRVLDTETIEEYKVTCFGDKFDLETYDKFVQLADNKYKHIFRD